jgi:hypothetical protein
LRQWIPPKPKRLALVAITDRRSPAPLELKDVAKYKYVKSQALLVGCVAIVGIETGGNYDDEVLSVSHERAGVWR